MKLVNAMLGTNVKIIARMARQNKTELKRFYKLFEMFLIGIILAPAKYLEEKIFKSKIEQQDMPEVVFIIGHWRSGTTHLHNLMVLNSKFGFFSTFESFFSSASIVLSKLKTFLTFVLPSTREIDNVALSANSAQEEELAIARNFHGSFYHCFNYPWASERLFSQYVLMQGIKQEDKKTLKNTYVHLVKKLAFLTKKKTILLKGPVNTGRVKFLLEIFPSAKFICIHRNPYDLFDSTLNLHRKLHEQSSLGKVNQQQLKINVLEQYKQLMAAYFEQKNLIPKENLFELKYEDLISHEFKYINKIHKELNLEQDPELLVKISQYLDSIKSFKRNRFERSAEKTQMITTNWNKYISKLGYSVN